ncbi:ribonuclease H-like domain-containing protein, partial [Tanacetum coccineum]
QYVAYKTNVAQQFTPQKHYRLPHPGQGILGPAPAIYASQPTPLPSAFSTMPLQDPTWHMDTGASSHLNFNASNLSTIFDKRLFPSVHVGDGKSIPVTNTGHSIIPSHHRPLHLHNVLVTPNIIKNLISVRQFTRDNNCTIEFDAFGFSVKDYLTRHILLRCDSSSDLYPVTKPSTSPIAFLSTSASTWHQRLGHPGDQYNTLVKNGTWILVPRLSDVNFVRSMWLFKHKFHADVQLLSRPPFAPFFLVVSLQWPIHQLDVKNAFLNGDLSETVYMHTPPGLLTIGIHNSFLYRDLYNGLKQAPHDLVFSVPHVMPHELDFIIVDAIPHCLSIDRIIGSLNNEFDMTNLGALNYFLGIFADRTPTGAPIQDPTLYRSLVGGLQYLTFIRPDLSYAVQQICLYMHDPREPHLPALKRILRYVQGTLDLGLHLYASFTTSLVGYTDADWAGCPSTRRSTSGYCVFLGDNLLSWSAKRQHTLSRSSVEAEYRGVVNVVAETAWLRNLLRELHSSLLTATLVYCDNVSAVYMSVNPVQHQRTKHIEIDIHFVRDMVTAGQVRVLHVPSRFQYADIFTKGLPSALFEEFRSSLSVRPPPAPTAGAY